MQRFSRFIVLPAVVALVSLVTPASAAPVTKETDARLVFLRTQGLTAASFAVVAKLGQAAAVAATVERLGGRVRYRFDGIDYLIAVLPTDRVEAFLADPALQSVTLDQPSEDYSYYAGWFTPGDEEPGEVPDTHGAPRNASNAPSATAPKVRGDGVDAPWPPEPSTRPLDHPYSILKDMDAQGLRDENPTYDGRGVVVAQVEWFPDFLLPELQVAKDLNGNRVRKFLDIINFSDLNPTLDEEPSLAGPEWVRLGDPVSGGPGSLVEFNGASFRLPDSGIYRLGELVIPDASPFNRAFVVLSATYESEKRGEGDDAKEVFVFPLAWSDERNTLWIDLNRDEDFTNDTPVVAFSRSGQFGILGRDDPETPQRETIAYAVQKEGDYVSVSAGIGSHASIVAGAVAASRGDKGKLDGVAPGAQLLVINHGSRASTFGRALITAFSDPRTDVVLVEGRFPVTALHNMKDGRSTLAIVHERLVKRYGKPTFFTAFNTPGMTTSADAANGDNVISVGAYQSAASVFANRGIKTRYADDLHWVGAEGPSGLGALKPDFLSPANPMTLFIAQRVDDFSSYAGIFELPVGYGIGGGTSTATPVATGAAAMLVSAARQKGIAWDAHLIHRAMRSTTRFLPDFPAYKQGRGLIQVAAAWRYMQVHSGGAEAMSVAVDAPVHTLTSHLLPTPNRGHGLFEREGWSVGDRGARTLTLTRTSGPDKPIAFDVEWVGNDAGTFSSVSQVSLPLNKPTSFKVSIHPKEPGAHSANARLRHVSLPGAVVHIPFTIVAPYEFNAENGFSQELSLQVDRPGRRNLFFRVPEGATAFSIDFSNDRERLGARIITPDNRGEGRLVYRDSSSGKGSGAVSNPTPGVWQVMFMDRLDGNKFDWEVRHEEYLPPIDVHLKATVSAVWIKAAPASAEAVREVAFENRMASFTGAAEGSIGALRKITGRLRPGQHRVFDLTIDSGTELLVAEIAPLGDEALDVDLYLYDCTGETCLPARYGGSYGAVERVLIDNPRAGAWKVVVSSQGVPGGEMTFEYHDFYTHPRFGALHVTDANATRETAQSWSAKAKAWLAEPPAEGRIAVGVLTISDPSKSESHKAINKPGEEWWKFQPTSDPVPLALEFIALQ